MTLVADLQRWYGCTQEAAEYIAQVVADNAAQTGQPLQNDLRHIAERAGLPFFIRREPGAPPMTLADVKLLQVQARKAACSNTEEGTTP